MDFFLTEPLDEVFDSPETNSRLYIVGPVKAIQAIRSEDPHLPAHQFVSLDLDAVVAHCLDDTV